MLHVVVASHNPEKIEATRRVFHKLFNSDNVHIESISVDSGVSAQPIGDKETRTGSRQRVISARTVCPEADYWVGIEAGVEENMTFSWITIENIHQRGEARSASMQLPPIVIEQLNDGKTLGESMSQLSGIDNLGQNGGAISYFTRGELSRSRVYHQALLLAFVPLQNDVYQKQNRKKEQGQ